MLPLTIALQRRENALEGDEAVDHYLDLDTGEILAVGPQAPVPGSAEKYDVQPERYLPIDPLAGAQSLAMREDFLYTQPDPHAHPLLSRALSGRRPLRTFDYGLEHFPRLREAWHAYRQRRLREYALEWLEDNGLEPAGELRSRAGRSPARR